MKVKSGLATTRDCGCRGWGWECRSTGAELRGMLQSGGRRRRRAGRVRGDAMRVRGSYQLWGNLEENPRMAEWGRLMR